MQLKTCTNPDRIMKHRHKILHSMEIAFSHVLWFEKERDWLRETDGDTQGEEKERGKKERDRCKQRVRSSQMESHRGEDWEQRGLGQMALSSLCLSCLCTWVFRGSAQGLSRFRYGQEGNQETSLLLTGGLSLFWFFSIFFLKHFPCFQVFKKQITHGILLNNKKEWTMDTQDTLDGSHGHYAEWKTSVSKGFTQNESMYMTF